MVAQPLRQHGRQRDGLVEVHQVSRPGDQPEPGTGDQRGQPLCAVDRDPGVVGAPGNEHGQVQAG